MKNLKDKIKQLIASGEDPELVKKLEEVLAESEEGEPEEDTAPPEAAEEEEEELLCAPTEIPLSDELFAGMRRLQAEKTNLEHALGVHYTAFHSRANNLVQEISLKAAAFDEERSKIIAESSPEGMAEEYTISQVADPDGTQTFFLKKIEKPDEEE